MGKNAITAFVMRAAVSLPVFLLGCKTIEPPAGGYDIRWLIGALFLLFLLLILVSVLFILNIKKGKQIKRTAELEAVVSGYKGIIWSVNKDKIITTFRGKHLKKLGLDLASLEGHEIARARENHKSLEIINNIEKTLQEGPQDWISEINGVIYHSFTSPVCDAKDNVIGVAGSADDVTDVIKMQQELKTAVETARAASESKSRFLANMSHEMRTPLNAIIGLSELELGNANLEGDSFTNMEKIYSAGINLLGIINDLLDISKIEAGKFVLIPVEYDVSSMINDTLNLNIIRIGSRPMQFHLHVSGSLPAQLEGDELRVKQVFNNLLSNAIKYTVSGYIDWTISCVKEREKNRVKIISTVRDTGIGIRKEDQAKLFNEDYYQTDLKTNYYMEGTGLGLPITMNLVRLMDGNISVQSEYRMGSAFTVEFYQKMVTDEEIGDEVAENLSQFRYSAHRRNKNQRLLRVNMSYASVLVVDDVIANLEVARGMLKPYKLFVECVTSGTEAVKRVREEKRRYDAIFMDHMMPDMDGMEAVRIIRNEIDTEYAKTVPIIALTANAVQGSDSMFLESGFQAFLSKPIDIIRLDQVLHTWVRDKEKESQLPQEEGAETAKDGLRYTKTLNIPGLNITNGLARFDNDEEAYLRVLRAYVTHTPNFINTVKTAGSDIDSYRIAVHSIKGSGRGIGAEKLGDMAERLETASKQNDIPFIRANNKQFIETAEKLIEALADFLKTVPADTEEQNKPEEETFDSELLRTLKQAAEDYNITTLNKTIEALDAFRYRSYPDLVKWLKERAGTSDFEAIKRKLNSL